LINRNAQSLNLKNPRSFEPTARCGCPGAGAGCPIQALLGRSGSLTACPEYSLDLGPLNAVKIARYHRRQSRQTRLRRIRVLGGIFRRMIASFQGNGSHIPLACEATLPRR
jgi:hypothetical protein